MVIHSASFMKGFNAVKEKEKGERRRRGGEGKGFSPTDRASSFVSA